MNNLVFTDQTLGGVHRSSVAFLEASGIDEADASARHLISEAAETGYRLSDFLNNQDLVLSEHQLATMHKFCLQRAEGMPVQYIIGNWDFFGLKLKCAPPVLIPRPETEELVEHCISTYARDPSIGSSAPLRILDIGCGTGAIGLALCTAFPKATCTALDVSADAVVLARENAALVLGPCASVRYNPVHMSFLEYCGTLEAAQEAVEYDLIVSNPPYIPTAQMSGLQREVKQYEDEGALHGGTDGLDIVRQILDKAPSLLGGARGKTERNDSRRREVWLEVSECHPDAVCAMDLPSFSHVTGLKDLFGHPRFIRLQLA